MWRKNSNAASDGHWIRDPRKDARPIGTAMALLDQALHGGRAGRMHRELVLEKQIAVEAGGRN